MTNEEKIKAIKEIIESTPPNNDEVEDKRYSYVGVELQTYGSDKHLYSVHFNGIKLTHWSYGGWNFEYRSDKLTSFNIGVFVDDLYESVKKGENLEHNNNKYFSETNSIKEVMVEKIVTIENSYHKAKAEVLDNLLAKTGLEFHSR